MQNRDAVNFVYWHTDERLRTLPQRPKVSFVSPIVSTVLAAFSLRNEQVRTIEFTDDAGSYAENIGLLEALALKTPSGQPGAYHGSTYSKLTRLATTAEINACNSVIVELLYKQLLGKDGGNKQFVNAVAKVVGELHDNVPSHSTGIGFSAAQVYRQGRPVLRFAIADSGCGMLANVQVAVPSVTNHSDAILWCLERGHTSAKERDTWAQRLPDDCMVSPLPESVSSFADENHHVGEGLWQLTELAKIAGGAAWIWSGNYTATVSAKGIAMTRTPPLWHGVAVELEFDTIEAQTALATQDASWDRNALAERLGL